MKKKRKNNRKQQRLFSPSHKAESVGVKWTKPILSMFPKLENGRAEKQWDIYNFLTKELGFPPTWIINKTEVELNAVRIAVVKYLELTKPKSKNRRIK